MLEKYYSKEEGYNTIIDNDGFCAYRFDSENSLFYIGHFFSEGGKSSYRFFDKVKKIAKNIGAKYLIGDLFLNDFNKNNYTKKLMVHIGHGYKIIDIKNNCITVMKEI